MAVGGTVNSNPQAWVNNCNPGAKGEPCAGDMVNELSKKVRGRAIASLILFQLFRVPHLTSLLSAAHTRCCQPTAAFLIAALSGFRGVWAGGLFVGPAHGHDTWPTGESCAGSLNPKPQTLNPKP